MAILEIPLNTADPAFKFQITLESVTYVFAYSFNKRMDRWTLDVMDESGNPIRMGMKLIEGWPINRQYSIAELFQGALALIDTAGEQAAPDKDTLGERVKMLYEETDG